MDCKNMIDNYSKALKKKKKQRKTYTSKMRFKKKNELSGRAQEHFFLIFWN